MKITAAETEVGCLCLPQESTKIHGFILGELRVAFLRYLVVILKDIHLSLLLRLGRHFFHALRTSHVLVYGSFYSHRRSNVLEGVRLERLQVIWLAPLLLVNVQRLPLGICQLFIHRARPIFHEGETGLELGGRQHFRLDLVSIVVSLVEKHFLAPPTLPQISIGRGTWHLGR